MSTHRRAIPVAPLGLTAYTRGVIDLARSKGFHLRWEKGKARHLLHLAASGPHGVSGHLVVGARSGKVLRALLDHPSDRRVVQQKAEGTNGVRALLNDLSPQTCTPGCTAPTVADCRAHALAA
ncbi:hypothetical protein QR97_01820 [Streptomyces sp. PBH53]|nr:hypothetical protein QR97_01820 [Streptomyces sp. PBH53]